jgi:hypothetical protein
MSSPHLGRRLAGAVVLSVAAVAAATATPADADTGTRAVRVASPSGGALVSSGQVPVRLAVSRNVTSVKVFSGVRDLSRRFRRSGNAFVASVPRTALAPGENRLVVQALAGRRTVGSAVRTFVVARPAAVRATVHSGPTAAAAMTSGPATTRGYIPADGALPVSLNTATPTTAVLTVNGHRVADARAARYATAHSWLVSRGDGLRPGVNRLVVRAHDRTGRTTVKRWTVKRTATQTLAEAGPRERVVTRNRWTRLDGTGSSPGVSYAWRIVRAPKGAKPTLRGASTATPRFKTDVPGVYQVALRATRKGAAKKASAADATANSSEDVTTLDVAPALGDQGLYVDTDMQVDPTNPLAGYDTITIAGQPYTMGAGGMFVQLDPATLTVLRSGPASQVQPTAGTITVGVWMSGAPASISTNPYGSAVWIGTQQVADNESATPPSSGPGNPTTALHGWLQPAPTDGQASWVGSDMLQVQTRTASSTTTTNTMAINGQTYTATLPAGDVGGYHLLVLDNDGNPANGADGKLYAFDSTTASATAAENQLATDLSNYEANAGRWTVLLEAFGSVPAVAQSTGLSHIIAQAGGHADVISRFNGKTDGNGGVYALIAGLHNSSGPQTQVKETSFERAQSGSLSSLMVRGGTYDYDDYIPFVADNGTPDPLNSNRDSLLPALYAAPASWTNWVRVDQTGPLRAPSAGETAALKYIVGYATNPDQDWVDIAQPCPNAPDPIRGYYCDTNANDLETLYDELSHMTYDAADGQANDYTAADFATVQNTLMWETLDAKGIRSAMAQYETLFGSVNAAGVVQAQSIADTVKGQLNVDNQASNTSHILGVISSVTDIASSIPGIGPAFTFTSGVFSLASNLVPNSSTTDVLPDTVALGADNAATELTADYQAASEQLDTYGSYMVEDPAKLLQMGDLLKGPMAMNATSLQQFQWAGQWSAKQFLWGAILGSSYAEWYAPHGLLPTNPKCYWTTGPFTPFGNMDATGLWTGPSPANAWSDWWIGQNMPTNAFQNLARDNTGLSSSITDNLFAPIDTTVPPMSSTSTGIGAVMPYFAEANLPFNQLPTVQYGQGNKACVYDYNG